ncbi:heme binding [Pyricularia grisea]|nr:heme binding [Pyricularia grisea]
MCIGEPSEWREIKLFEAIQRIVISVNSSSFVGRDLGTNQNWLRAIYNLPLQLGIPTIILGYTPFLIRPFAKPFLFAPLNMTQRKIKRMMKPILQDNVREYKTSADKKNLLSPKEQGKMQLTGWLLSRYKGKLDFEVLLQNFITVLFESTPSTASTLFHVVCELAADPSLQDMLRQELEEQTDQGNLPQTHLNELRKMDSVMRESARVSPFSYQLWDRTHEFDGLRHYKARQKPQNENRFKFANLGSDAPSWGDGRQACPGRMFANNTIKIILTHLLLNYDVKLRPGESKPEKGAMPNGSIVPDVWAKVLFRSRSPTAPMPIPWDPYRYIKMREAGQESKAHLVSVTPQHFGFGHGIHACPGRFFAANELKILLAQMLLKYDIKVPKDVESLPKSFSGSSYVIPRGTRFLMKRRQEELDLNTLEI